jgi:hypothetical protein
MGQEEKKGDLPCVHPTTPKAYSKTALAEGSFFWNYHQFEFLFLQRGMYLVGDVSLFISPVNIKRMGMRDLRGRKCLLALRR